MLIAKPPFGSPAVSPIRDACALRPRLATGCPFAGALHSKYDPGGEKIQHWSSGRKFFGEPDQFHWSVRGLKYRRVPGGQGRALRWRGSRVLPFSLKCDTTLPDGRSLVLSA